MPHIQLALLLCTILAVPRVLSDQGLVSRKMTCNQPDNTEVDIRQAMGTDVKSIVTDCIACFCLNGNIECNSRSKRCSEQPPTLDVQKQLVEPTKNTKSLRAPKTRSTSTQSSPQPSTTPTSADGNIPALPNHLKGVNTKPKRNKYHFDFDYADDGDSTDTTQVEPDSHTGEEEDEEVQTTTATPRRPAKVYKTRAQCLEEGITLMHKCPGTAEFDADVLAHWKIAQEETRKELAMRTSTTMSPPTTPRSKATTMQSYLPLQPSWRVVKSSPKLITTSTEAPSTTTTTTTARPQANSSSKLSTIQQEIGNHDLPTIIGTRFAEFNQEDLDRSQAYYHWPGLRNFELAAEKPTFGRHRAFIEPKVEQVLDANLPSGLAQFIETNGWRMTICLVMVCVACITIICIFYMIKTIFFSLSEIINHKEVQESTTQKSTSRSLGGSRTLNYNYDV